MEAINLEESSVRQGTTSRADTLAVVGIAVAVAVIHLLTNNRYGFHRDELQFLSDARHLDWGFVAYPPFTPFVERIGLEIFGVSLVGLRLFSVIAQAMAIVVTGLMARELGGEVEVVEDFLGRVEPMPGRFAHDGGDEVPARLRLGPGPFQTFTDLELHAVIMASGDGLPMDFLEAAHGIDNRMNVVTRWESDL